jgi:hypothetical protein
LVFPDVLFDVVHQFRWRESFLVGMGYLYALCSDGFNTTTRINIKELMKVLDTDNVHEVYEFFEQMETVNRLVVIEAEGVEKDNFVKLKRGEEGELEVEVELIILQEFSYYLSPDGEFFPVPKITFLLPVSVQAKAIYLLFYHLKDRNSQLVTVSYKTIAKKLRINAGKVKNYLQELIELNLLVRKGKSQYFLRELGCLDSELFLEIQKIYGSDHPFLKELNMKPDEESSEI